ncbi:hypothetical protein BDY21DRAFT_287250 [Lineolata rhizophorae]|uniref:PhoD-like phosphatase domain-containing protein n=1 Tax=Lineolata rhizophorae TaxID=578093 RepID=A0A6A6NZY8_9PEZI|nr:hypothetical protein BDY21DRAFT_287250 [Lineolata rhizophorae]
MSAAQQPSAASPAVNTTVPEQQQNGAAGVGRGPQIVSTSEALEVLSGPLLNYKRMSKSAGSGTTWHGTVLLVTTAGQRDPQLTLRFSRPVSGNPSAAAPAPERTVGGTKLYEDPKKCFFRFDLDVPFADFEAMWEYSIPGVKYVSADSVAEPKTCTRSFAVPARNQSMRIMFHSCNGFSVGTDMAVWQGPSLWNDVLRMHAQEPMHVMIGGGDQIYNDSVRVDGPLRPWTDIGNPHKRREFPFDEKMRAECDDYYFDNYARWYGTEPFKTANAQIPQLNIWDDHDIIDGFGSYTDHFMRCAVFRGIGGVAHKYYMLFQHHIAPPRSTFTTDAPKTMHTEGTTPADFAQLKDTFVLTETSEDPSYIIGEKPGPYVEERSRNIYCQLGARIAFLGIDARTERTRHQINYPETYDLIFKRASAELSANKDIKHLILLLGVPIAYPRLQWLENILRSPIIGPLRLLNKRFGIAGGFFNQFDGSVDLLDDLDDHYTAHQHKHERRDLMHRLQELAKQHSVRVTILGGDVHLAALGRFYSKPKLNIPAERDFRYMANVISSAITNKPPPAAVANLLAKRNKIHHMDHDTDETMLELFNHDPGMGKNGVNGNANLNGAEIAKKTNDSNHTTMPSRNYAIIAESNPEAAASGASAAAAADGENPRVPNPDPRHQLHVGEVNAGTDHPAASGLRHTGLCGTYGLDVTFRIEISPKDTEGRTEGYGFSIPGLEASAYQAEGSRW